MSLPPSNNRTPTFARMIKSTSSVVTDEELQRTRQYELERQEQYKQQLHTKENAQQLFLQQIAEQEANKKEAQRMSDHNSINKDPQFVNNYNTPIRIGVSLNSEEQDQSNSNDTNFNSVDYLEQEKIQAEQPIQNIESPILESEEIKYPKSLINKAVLPDNDDDSQTDQMIKEILSTDANSLDYAQPITLQNDHIKVKLEQDDIQVLAPEEPLINPNNVQTDNDADLNDVANLDLNVHMPESTEKQDTENELIQNVKKSNFTMKVPFCTTEEIVNDHFKLVSTMKDEDAYERALAEDQRLNDILEESRFFTTQQGFNKDALTIALNNEHELSRRWTDPQSGKVHGPMTISKKHMNKFPSGTSISGDDASIFVAAMTNGVKQVYLANSGFYISLRAPKNTELALFQQAISDRYFEHGKTLGQYYFIPADTDIKDIVMSILPSLVVRSNLHNWNLGDTLLKHISYHDYDVILWALATLMHPDGVYLDFFCHEKDCKNPKQTLHVDINQIIFYNYTIMSLESKRFLYSHDVKNHEQLSTYRTSLGFNVERKLQDNWYGHMQIPTMHEHLEYSRQFNTELASHIQVTEEDDVNRHLTYARNQFFAPWIEKIVCKEDGREIIIPDRSSIPNVIGQLQTLPDGSTDFFNHAKEYIAETKLTHIGYPYDVCPSCGKPVKSAVGGIIPCDVQSTFFYLSVMRLRSL